MSPERMQSRAITAMALIKAGWLVWGGALAVAIIYPRADDVLVGLYVVALFHLLRYNYWAWNGNERLRAREFGPPAKTWPPYIGIANVVVFIILLMIGRNTSRTVRLTLFSFGFASATFWLRACCNAFCWWVRDQVAADNQQSPTRGKCAETESELNSTDQQTKVEKLEEVR